MPSDPQANATTVAYSPSRAKRLERLCKRKRRHTTALTAMLHVQQLERHGDHNRRGVLVYYHCQFCNGYHVGHDKTKDDTL